MNLHPPRASDITRVVGQGLPFTDSVNSRAEGVEIGYLPTRNSSCPLKIAHLGREGEFGRDGIDSADSSARGEDGEAYISDFQRPRF